LPALAVIRIHLLQQVEHSLQNLRPVQNAFFCLEGYRQEHAGFPIYQIDFDENVELKERLGVKGFLTMIFFKNGEEAGRMEGLKQKPAIAKAIESLVS
jgi:thioredoxin 1